MDLADPTYYVEKTAHLRYIFAYGGQRIFVSGIDRISQSKDVCLELRKGVNNYGWVVLNLDQVSEAREVDYCLSAMEQSLEALGVREEAFRVDEQAIETLEFFIDRFSAERSVIDEKSFRAVFTAVRDVVRTARSPRVEGDDAVGDLGRVVKGVFGVLREASTVLFGVVRAARSPPAAVAELTRAGLSSGVKGDNSLVRLARAALGEVRAARARPVVLAGDLLLQLASGDAVAELLSTTPPRTRGVWSTVRVLDVRGLVCLSEAPHVYDQVQQCCAVGWRVPQLKMIGEARMLDSHAIMLSNNVKLAFGPKILRADGSIDSDLLSTISELGKELVRFCTDDIQMFQSEVATLPDAISEMLGATNVPGVRRMGNRVMVIVHHIRAQRVLF